MDLGETSHVIYAVLDRLSEMVNGEKNDQESSIRGNDWEVVSLTASAYAAYPGPNRYEDNQDVAQDESRDVQQEHLSTMFMSQHFVVPPARHENLPLPCSETPSTVEVNVLEVNMNSQQDVHHSSQVCEESLEVDHAGRPKLDREEGETLDGALPEWNFGDMQRPVKDLEVSKSVHEIPFFYEKGEKLPFSGKSLEEVDSLQGLEWVEPNNLSGKLKEQSIHESAKLGSFYSESDKSGPTTLKDSALVEDDLLEGEFETEESSSQLGHALDSEKCSKIVKGTDGIGPDQAWWKRQAASFYAQAREANTLWSVFVAAAVMGLVILGHRWKHEKLQIQKHKWQIHINDEKLSRMLAPVSRVKDALIGHRRTPVVRYSSSAEL